MADRGITFSAAMVRALLDGRKTQTRRLIQPVTRTARPGDIIVSWPADAVVRQGLTFRPPHQPGDRLYVREHWKVWQSEDAVAPRDMPAGRLPIHYLADLPAPFDPFLGRHRQAMHMPRWASRLTLLVTDVRVQRLQDVSKEDAVAEGIVWQEPTAEDFEWAKAHEAEYGEPCEMQGVWIAPGTDCGFGPKPRQPLWGCTAKQAYGFLWNTLHTDPGTRWEDNPWIYAVSFDVVRGNIDQIGGEA